MRKRLNLHGMKRFIENNGLAYSKRVTVTDNSLLYEYEENDWNRPRDILPKLRLLVDRFKGHRPLEWVLGDDCDEEPTSTTLRADNVEFMVETSLALQALHTIRHEWQSIHGRKWY